MNTNIYTKTSILLLLGAILVYTPLFILFSFFPGPFIITTFIRIAIFFIAIAVYLILYRLFFEKILDEANIAGESQREDRRSDMEIIERFIVFLMGLILLTITIIVLAEARQLEVFGYKKLILFVSSIFNIILYTFAGIISGGIILSLKQHAQKNKEIKQAVLKMLLRILANMVQSVVMILLLLK